MCTMYIYYALQLTSCALIYHIIYTFRTQYFFILSRPKRVNTLCAMHSVQCMRITYNIYVSVCMSEILTEFATRLDLQEIAGDYL